MPETARDPLDTAVATVLDEIGTLREERDYYLGLLIALSLRGFRIEPFALNATPGAPAEAARLRASYREAGSRHDSDDGWMGEPVGSYRRLARGND